ncbi:hypothetical protein, partial [Pseudomonas asplenii]|uniref:hypothetical protein n=1 Tax=Pseudomonas asplenii TaxID=53407 RepID=UPI001ED8FAD4
MGWPIRLLRWEKLFKPARISDNWCWHIAFIQFNICHRIDANDLANLRHDAGLISIQVEHLAKHAVLLTSC